MALEADGQRLRVTKRPDTIAAGTSGELRLSFRLSPEWAGRVLVADFGTEAVPVVGGTCMVPDSVTSLPEIPVRLVGQLGGKRLTSSVTRIAQRRS